MAEPRRAADHLVARDAVQLLGERAHEVNAASRHDERAVPVRAQVCQHLQHRPVGHVEVAAAGPRMPGRRQPCAHGPTELVGGHAAVGRGDQRRDAPFALRRNRTHVSAQDRRERLGGCPLRVRALHRPHAVDDEGQLHVGGLLGPQRAVVVEDRDALAPGEEVRARWIRGSRDERLDGRAGGPVLPRRQGRVLRARGLAASAARRDDRRRGQRRRDEQRDGRAPTHRRRPAHCPCGRVTASITRSRLKLPGFWRGGNSRKLCSQRPT